MNYESLEAAQAENPTAKLGMQIGRTLPKGKKEIVKINGFRVVTRQSDNAEFIICECTNNLSTLANEKTKVKGQQLTLIGHIIPAKDDKPERPVNQIDSISTLQAETVQSTVQTTAKRGPRLAK